MYTVTVISNFGNLHMELIPNASSTAVRSHLLLQ